MLRILKVFKNKKVVKDEAKKVVQTKDASHVAMRKGEIGEYKIDIQLSQFPKNYRFLTDVMIENRKSISGYSQIDHLIITPYGIFVIETKNYQGTIYGGKERKTWLVNGKFKMMNPLFQNYGHVQAIKQLINEKREDTLISLVTFTKRCTLKIGDDIRHISSNEMVVYDYYLTETIQRKVSLAKLKSVAPLYTDNEIKNIHDAISEANIVDLAKRLEHTQSIEKAVKDKSPNSDTQNQLETCVLCNKSVSDKVKNYCLNNEKRFHGKVYCYEHQKSL